MRRRVVIYVASAIISLLSIVFYYEAHYWLRSKSFVVELTDNGFNPQWLKISKNDSVLFINKGKLPHWPASDDHPFHQRCPGFDAARPLNSGESYVLKFDFNISRYGLCSYHDHLDPNRNYIIEIVR